MNCHNFNIGVVDTDSISFCNRDGSPFSKEELKSLLQEINDLCPEFITFEDDGYYKKCIVLKAKNYILYDPTKEKERDRKQVKGSAFKSSSKEPAIAQMMQDMVNAILDDKQGDLLAIYEQYVDEALNVTDIHRWAKKISATESILACRNYTLDDIASKRLRRNETNVWDAIKNEERIQQGDKYYIYPAVLSSETVTTTKTSKKGKISSKSKVVEAHGLMQSHKWDANAPNHIVSKLLERLYCTMEIFQFVLDINMFNDYSLVKNYKALVEKKNVGN